MPKEELKKYGKDAVIQEGFPWEEEFKTLKDLTHHWIDSIKRKRHTLEAEEIKAEAIKWIKEINKDGGMCHTCDELWNKFFNISEEDLK